MVTTIAVQPEGPGFGGDLPFVARCCAAVTTILALTWLCWAITIPAVMGSKTPAFFAGWPGGRDAALLRIIESVTDTATPDRLAAAELIAKRALDEEPLNVAAARTLGLIADFRGNQKEAFRRLRYAESVSRRDDMTELLLIEMSVQRGDVNGALLHYDRILRRSIDARELLFPILVSATLDPNVEPALAAIVARKPSWWGWFTNRVIGEKNASSIFLYHVALKMKPRMSDPLEKQFIGATINRLIADGKVRQALEMYHRALPQRRASYVRDGEFEQAQQLPPLDWTLTDDGTFNAAIDRPGNGSSILSLSGSVERGGVLASQIITLPTGRFSLSVVAGSMDVAGTMKPSLTISCVETGLRFAELSLGDASKQRLLMSSFSVPSECKIQRLDVTAGLMESALADNNRPWIDDVKITRLP